MSNFVVNINDAPAEHSPLMPPKSKWPAMRVISWIARFFLLMIVIAGISGYFYWRHLKTQPQYSLALLVDAARNDDQAAIDTLVDTDAVVDDFLPQITEKAVEIYGRGVPPAILARVAAVTAPVLPAVKQKAREELPKAIRQKTDRLSSVPFASMVVGADRYLDIIVNGDTALVKSKLAEHSFEVTMKRNGDRWKIVGVKDEKLATNIAQRIGQDIIGIAAKGGITSAADKLGIKNINELMKQADQIFNSGSR